MQVDDRSICDDEGGNTIWCPTDQARSKCPSSIQRKESETKHGSGESEKLDTEGNSWNKKIGHLHALPSFYVFAADCKRSREEGLADAGFSALMSARRWVYAPVSVCKTTEMQSAIIRVICDGPLALPDRPNSFT